MTRLARTSPREVTGLLLVAALSGAPIAARAGPPFVTDDPEPVDVGHWEVYGYSTGAFVRGEAAATAPGLEVNYGALPNLQLHVIAPLAFNSQDVTGTRFGPGDIEFGAKYRLINPSTDDWWPQVGVFPMIDAPTGDAGRGLGTGKVHAFLPVWLQKDFGKWTTYGGGGYWINPGPGNKNYWLFGWLLQRQVTDKLALGGEVFHQAASATGGPDSIGYPLGSRDTTGFNFGGVYDLTGHDHLLFSAGRGLQNAVTTDGFSYYLGYQWTY